VGVVLLVACANVANLFLVRSEARQREVAVRRALGAGRLGIARTSLPRAAPESVARMIVRQSSLVALAGITIGLAAAFAGGQLIESLLFGVSPRDPMAFGVTTLALFGVGLLACWLPARRAARLSPVLALRME
jgi:putative ABC transport system permease protein